MAGCRRRGENRFDAAKNRDCGCLARSCSLCGDNHHCFIFFEIRECSRGHSIDNPLLKVRRLRGHWNGLRLIHLQDAAIRRLSL